jgi:hypothetical protein
MRGLVAAAVLLAATGTLAAQDKRYESKEGKFSISFPGTPKTESKKVGDVTINTTALDAKGLAYMVIYSDLPAEAVKASKPEEILDNGEKGLVTSFKAKVTKSQPTTFGGAKYPARLVTADIKVDATTLKLRLLIVLANNRVYQVLVLGNADGVGGRAADQFLESLEIGK